MPVFSIIIPTYNASSKVALSIDSILAQNHGLAEILVMDGGSKDDTVDIVRSYGNQVQLVSEKDKGLYDAMNKGIARSTGRFLNFLGAGDTIRPGILEMLAGRLPDTPLSVLYGRVWLRDAGHEHGERFTKMILRNGNVPHQSMFYNRAVFDRLGLYDIQYKTGADYVFCIKAFGDDAIEKIYVDAVIAEYEGGGVSTTYNDKELRRDRPGLILKHLGWKPYLALKLSALIPMGLREARARRKHAGGGA